MPTVDFYSKGQTDTLLSAKANSTDLPSSAQLVPSTSGASSGDVLAFNGSSTAWTTPSGGGATKHTYNSISDLFNAIKNNEDCVVKVKGLPTTITQIGTRLTYTGIRYSTSNDIYMMALDVGPNRYYMRGVYTHINASSLEGSMVSFDASSTDSPGSYGYNINLAEYVSNFEVWF